MDHFRIALKYLRSERHHGLAMGNLISIIGIFLGVSALIIVMSVMNGLEQEISERLIGLHSDIKIFGKDLSPIENWQPIVQKVSSNLMVIGVSPICQSELMLVNNNNLSGTICQGVILDMHKETTRLLHNIYIGNPEEKGLASGIILGSDLAAQLRVNYGDTVALVSPIADQPTPFGLLPLSKNLTVVGLFYTGLPEYDMKYSFTDLGVIQEFMGMNGMLSFLEVKTSSSKKSYRTADKLQKQLGSEFEVLDWREFEQHLFSAIQFEKRVMFTVLVLIFIVTAFNMIGTYLKMTAEKRADIGIMKSLGATSQDVARIFMLHGLMVGIIGTAAGFILSLLLLGAQIKWEFVKIPIAGMPFQAVPVDIQIIDLVIVVIAALGISILTTFVPARKIAKLDAIKIIREKEE
jgi:lipoprotein-releasing system permease protein